MLRTGEHILTQETLAVRWKIRVQTLGVVMNFWCCYEFSEFGLGVIVSNHGMIK
jgi:hypothetical protein